VCRVGRAVRTEQPITGADRQRHAAGQVCRTTKNTDRVRPLQGVVLPAVQRELRNNRPERPDVLRLTIEPDGSVSMCALQSTDMDAPDLATQVVGGPTINFGAKDGVPA